MNSGITSDHKAIVPSAYEVYAIHLINHKNELVDIQNIVTEFTIQESVYSSTLVATISVKDSTNSIEFLNIVGQERLEIHLYRKDPFNQEKEVKLDFYVTEYPLYSKVNNDNTQVYTFSAISKYAYLSELKHISRAYEGNTLDVVQNILTSDLKVDSSLIQCDSSQCITNTKGILTYDKPLNCIRKLLQVASDKMKTPFYFYQTLSGKLHIRSYSELVNVDKSYNTYFKMKDFKSTPQTKEDYLERLNRILEITSDLKLGTIFQAKEGAYASENNKLDVATKMYTITPYDYTKDYQAETLKGYENKTGKSLSNTFTVQNQTLNQYTQSYREHIATNSLSFSDTPYQNIHNARSQFEANMRSNRELFDTVTHDIRLYGDFDLNAGTRIDIRLSKAIAAESIRETLGESPSETVDTFLSGSYLITSVKHIFSQGKYFVNCRIKRDSLYL